MKIKFFILLKGNKFANLNDRLYLLLIVERHSVRILDHSFKINRQKKQSMLQIYQHLLGFSKLKQYTL